MKEIIKALQDKVDEEMTYCVEESERSMATVNTAQECLLIAYRIYTASLEDKPVYTQPHNR